MRKHWLKWLIGALVLIAVAGLFMNSQDEERVAILVHPTVGPFKVAVTVTGELRAKNSVEITGPANVRRHRIGEMTILRLVDEGTIVQEGDFVAELDRSELNTRIKDEELELQGELAEYEQAALDTLMTLSQARDEQVNLRYAMEEARLRVEQAIYEAPSIQRQAEIDYEKAKRAYEQSIENYDTQVRQSAARMREVAARLAQTRNEYNEMVALLDKFTVTAPQNGMVIYHTRRGQRITQGSTISAWDPIVAELPDLSVMESVTYVNEVDIQKVAVGQPVEISLDAFPDKTLSGTVTRIANIGEQLPNSDAKAFEVVAQVNSSDPMLRPAMTTSNTIIVTEVPEALQVPLETLHTLDSLNYVFLKQGGGVVRQEVRLGLLNENNVIVHAGLEPSDQVFLSVPADTSGLAFHRLERSGSEQVGGDEVIAARDGAQD